MKISRLFLLVAVLLSSVSSASAYSEEQLRGFLKAGINMHGFDCGHILEVKPNDDGVAYDVLCSKNIDGSGGNTLFYMLVGGAKFFVKIIDQR